MDEQRPAAEPPSKVDVSILALGVATGAWSWFSLYRRTVPDGERGAVLLFVFLALGFVSGLAWSGPAVLVVQRGRGRQTPLEGGEWLWAASAPMLSAAAFFTAVSPALWPLLLLLAFVSQVMLSIAAAVVLILPRTLWTETVGCWSCILTGLVLVGLPILMFASVAM